MLMRREKHHTHPTLVSAGPPIYDELITNPTKLVPWTAISCVKGGINVSSNSKRRPHNNVVPPAQAPKIVARVLLSSIRCICRPWHHPNQFIWILILAFTPNTRKQVVPTLPQPIHHIFRTGTLEMIWELCQLDQVRPVIAMSQLRQNQSETVKVNLPRDFVL